jgi:hypothetical protein
VKETNIASGKGVEKGTHYRLTISLVAEEEAQGITYQMGSLSAHFTIPLEHNPQNNLHHSLVNKLGETLHSVLKSYNGVLGSLRSTSTPIKLNDTSLENSKITSEEEFNQNFNI